MYSGPPERGSRGRGRGRGRGSAAPYQQSQRFNDQSSSGPNVPYQRDNGVDRGSSAPRGRGASRGTRGRGGSSASDSNASFANLDISGYPDDLSYNEFLAFFNTYGPPGFRFNKLDYKPGRTRMQVFGPNAPELIALSGRHIRPNFPILVEHGTNYGRPLQPQEKTLIRQLLASRFDAASQALDLSNLQAAIAFADFSSKSFTSELWSAIEEVAPGVISINFAGNNLTSLASFTRLGQLTPSLRNLSLSHNNLDKIEQLDYLSSFRDQLNELILTNNPFHPATAQQQAAQQQQINSLILPQSASSSTAASPSPSISMAMDPLLYHHMISSMFPNLKLLDGSPLQPLISFDLPPIISTSTLPPIRDSFFDTPKNAEIVKSFVEKYFTLYDTDRQKLVSAYSDNAMFSLSLPVVESSPTGPAHTAQPLIHPAYVQLNRNAMHLAKTSGKNQASASASLLKTGLVNTVHTLSQLPPTQHDIASFVADVVLLPTNSLFLTLRGSMLEWETNTLRAFHRVFLLSVAGSDAASRGWAVQIQHDQLFLGAAKIQVKQSAPVQIPASPQPATSPSPDVQNLVMQLAIQAQCDQNTAFGALTQTNGNLEQALQLIRQMQGQQ